MASHDDGTAFRAASSDFPRGIGLALSGGGTRASSYHLGVLAYLHHLGWLERVERLSSVSGGTFIGVTLTYHLASRAAEGNNNDDPFADYFAWLYGLSQQAYLFERGFDALAEGRARRPSGRQELLTSMSVAYDEVIFNRQMPRLEMLRRGRFSAMPLQHVVFGATELQHGGWFRFGWSALPGFRANGASWCNLDSIADEIALADVIAASSCVPVLFEPLEFPEDFAWRGPPPRLNATQHRRVLLVDGGMHDNQGLEALLTEHEWSARRPVVPDLLIVSDTDSLPLECPPKPRAGSNALPSVRWLDEFVWFLATGVVVSLSGTMWLLTTHFLVALALLPAVVVATATIGAILWARHYLRKELRSVPGMLSPGKAEQDFLWQALSRLSIGRFLRLVWVRALHVKSIFLYDLLNRVRLLGYAHLAERNATAARNLVQCWISLISLDRVLPGNAHAAPPGAKTRKVAYLAKQMPTEFWFDNPLQEPCLVATGMFSACRALLREVDERIALGRQDIFELQALLLTEWNHFARDPFWLLKQPPYVRATRAAGRSRRQIRRASASAEPGSFWWRRPQPAKSRRSWPSTTALNSHRRQVEHAFLASGLAQQPHLSTVQRDASREAISS